MVTDGTQVCRCSAQDLGDGVRVWGSGECAAIMDSLAELLHPRWNCHTTKDLTFH